MASAVKHATGTKTQAPPRILLVDDEPEVVDVISRVIRHSVGGKIFVANSIAAARQAIASQDLDLLVADVHLPDGTGTSLLSDLRKLQPTAAALMITGAPSFEHAVSAMRGGAVDFLAKPCTPELLGERIKRALEKQAVIAKEEGRFERLRDAVKRLNASRRVISKKVDLLCNDLVSAYGDLSRQMDAVRTQEGFRKYIAAAKDLEQLLCHAMDWLLRQLGYSNVAMWLAGEDGEFQLGAYMKYTVPGESVLTDALQRVVLPIAARDSLVRLHGEDLADQLSPQELAYFKGQDILAVNCTYLGESLAAMVFFRDLRSPFRTEDESLLKSICPLFAVSLASVVRDTQGDEMDEEDEESKGLSGGGSAGGLTEDSDKPRKNADADWWKRGEPPPF